MNLPSINGASMSSHTKPVTLIAFCYLQSGIIGKAKSVIRHLGPSYTVDEVITVLTQEYEGVVSSDVIFEDFYQLKQECSEKVQVFSI